MLRTIFLDLLDQYGVDEQVSIELWDEVEQAYSHKKRHYHTLEHLQNLLNQLLEIRANVQEWTSTLFSVFYHDIVYNPLNKDNEEKSALFAEKKMNKLGVQQETIQKVVRIILATKKHLPSTDMDINYFTDADLCILGFPWKDYKQYADGVRKEYSIYPDIIYKPDRKKVLLHFLQMNSIYKTAYFKNKFENQAKENLQQELELY